MEDEELKYEEIMDIILADITAARAKGEGVFAFIKQEEKIKCIRAAVTPEDQEKMAIGVMLSIAPENRNKALIAIIKAIYTTAGEEVPSTDG
jgi:hypothetical protein